MYKLFFATAIVLVISLSTFTQAATYGGGSGTEADPYQICTPEQMNTIGANPTDLGMHFKLMADIDMSAYTGTQYNIIGNSWENPFTGFFDGNGYVIHNLSYTTTEAVDYVGLFGYTNNAIIENLGVENTNLSTGSNYAGGLVGYQTSGTITNCYSTGSVTSSCCVGGLTGYQDEGAITSCYSTCSVASYSDSYSSFAGGLVGFQYAGTITYCYSMGSVTTASSYSSFAGGLVGHQSFGIITSCYSTGIVTASSSGNKMIGGLVGSGSAVINSFWDIQTSGLTYSGGGNGRTTAQLKQSTNYIGWNTPTQVNWVLNEGFDYPRLTWEDQTGTPLTAQTFSDFVPGAGTASDPYRISTPGQLNVIGLFPNEWSKVFCLENDIDLSAFTGTEYNRIGVINYMKSFTGTLDGHGYVIRNLTYITTGAVNYVGLFGGIFGATIKNIDLENVNISTRGNYAGGLAGYQGRGTLMNCHCTGSITIISSSSYPSTTSSSVVVYSYAGGLVGYQSYGTITNCYSTGAVTATTSTTSTTSYSHSYAGGLVGYQNFGTITNCCSTGSVYSSAYSAYPAYSNAGGLVGWQSHGTITNCYSMDSVTSYSSRSSYAGGLVGYQISDDDYDDLVAKIKKCYSTGQVSATGISIYKGGLLGHRDIEGGSVITDCFWDTQTSGQTVGVGAGSGTSTKVTGKTTAEMKILSTFTSAGWDFSATDGDPADWMMLRESEDYPRLAWQMIYAGDIAGLYGVNLADYAKIAAHWGQTGCPTGCENADINNDGTVDINDLISLADNWLEGI